MLHPSFFTPEQLARANELAGDLTLATDNAEADTRARMLRELREATASFLRADQVFIKGGSYHTHARMRLVQAKNRWVAMMRLVQAKNRWVATFGELPEL